MGYVWLRVAFVGTFVLLSFTAFADHGDKGRATDPVCLEAFVPPVSSSTAPCRADSFLLAHLAQALHCAQPGNVPQRYAQSFADYVSEKADIYILAKGAEQK